METSVPHARAESTASDPRCSESALRPTPSEASAQSRGGRRNLSVVNELAFDLPITDTERQLVSAYLGDLIRQILSEPE